MTLPAFLHSAIRGPIVSVLLAMPFALLAAPGAHGPNGEHLDQQAPPGSAAPASPRVEMKSELFEAVGQLHDGELSLLVDRYETNEPILGARVEIESGKAKAVAKFHADHGDYSVDDADFLRALRAPGEHPLVVTIIAGQQSDLLEGTLRVPTTAHADDHSHGHELLNSRNAWLAGGGAAALLLAAALLRRKARDSRKGEPA